MIKLFLKIRLILQFKTLSSLSANWLTLQLQTNLKTNPSPAGHRNQDLKMHQWKSRQRKVQRTLTTFWKDSRKATQKQKNKKLPSLERNTILYHKMKGAYKMMRVVMERRQNKVLSNMLNHSKQRKRKILLQVKLQKMFHPIWARQKGCRMYLTQLKISRKKIKYKQLK